MPEPTQKPADHLRGFDATTTPHPHPKSNQIRENSDKIEFPPIPKSFLGVILETIAKSIEQALADAITRCISLAVEQKLRPLTEEIALLRTAIEYDWDDSGQRRRRNYRHKHQKNSED